MSKTIKALLIGLLAAPIVAIIIGASMGLVAASFFTVAHWIAP